MLGSDPDSSDTGPARHGVTENPGGVGSHTMLAACHDGVGAGESVSP